MFFRNKYDLKKSGDFTVSEGHGYPLVQDNKAHPIVHFPWALLLLSNVQSNGLQWEKKVLSHWLCVYLLDLISRSWA
jgi:hypothetical protein